MANQTTPTRMADGRMGVNLDTSKTLATTDMGIVQNVIADAITITLPSTAAGNDYIIRNGGAKPTGTPTGAVSDGSVLVTVAPAAADGVAGNGFTAAANKGALNTKATSRVGDEIEVTGTGTAGVTAWTINRIAGTWVRVP